MTDEAKALVERLRGGWNDWTTLTEIEAADLIETQAREIERLREELTRLREAEILYYELPGGIRFPAGKAVRKEKDDG